MTSTISPLTELLTDCGVCGIRLSRSTDGDLTVDAPEDALTPDLISRLKDHKSELLTVLDAVPTASRTEPATATDLWRATLALLEGNPLFPSDLMKALFAADACWARTASHAESVTEAESSAAGPHDLQRQLVDPNDVIPCPDCGSLDQWQTLAGNWRCQKCDPPNTARRLRRLAARLRSDRTASHGPNSAAFP